MSRARTKAVKLAAVHADDLRRELNAVRVAHDWLDFDAEALLLLGRMAGEVTTWLNTMGERLEERG